MDKETLINHYKTGVLPLLWTMNIFSKNPLEIAYVNFDDKKIFGYRANFEEPDYEPLEADYFYTDLVKVQSDLYEAYSFTVQLDEEEKTFIFNRKSPYGLITNTVVV